MFKRLIGSGLLAGGVALAMVLSSGGAAMADPGAAVAVITGTVNTAQMPIQFSNLALAGDFAAVNGTSVANCAGQVTTSGVTIKYSLESPAVGPIPAGTLYNVGSFDTSTNPSFAGPCVGGGTVAGTLGNGTRSAPACACGCCRWRTSACNTT